VNGFWRDAWTALKAVGSWITASVAFGLALLGSIWDPGIKVQVGLIWLAVFVLAVLAVLAATINMAVTARRNAQAPPPKAMHVVVPVSAGQGMATPLILIMERSRLFSVNTLVSIYYVDETGPGRDDVFEQSIGIGRVANVQENGRRQVQVLKEVANRADLWQPIRNREMAVVGRTVIKPSIDFNEAGVEVWFNE
jgi:hypothetical protein